MSQRGYNYRVKRFDHFTVLVAQILALGRRNAFASIWLLIGREIFRSGAAGTR
jgi:hypothetical protein